MLKKTSPRRRPSSASPSCSRTSPSREDAVKAGGGAGWGHLSAAIASASRAAGGALCPGQDRRRGLRRHGPQPRRRGARSARMAFLGLVLIESLVIYALVIAFVINGK